MRHAGGDAAVDWDIDDFGAIEFVREGDGAGFAGEALDDAFSFEGAEVADGCRLAGEAEVVLDLPGGRHEAGAPLSHFEIFDDLVLALGEVRLFHFS